MNLSFYSRRAFTMVEVIVAALLFAVSAAGIFATISYTTSTTISDNRIKAGLYSKRVLDSLTKSVASNTWDTSSLSVGNHTWPSDSDFPGYNASYVVTDAGGARKVQVNVVW